MVFNIYSTFYESFQIKDLRLLSYFLGLQVHQTTRGIIDNQHKDLQDLIACQLNE